MALILIIDDDPDMCEAVTLVLTRAGHEVSSANSRQRGMQAVDEVKPDLLILDVMMEEPDDGFAMAHELKAKGFRAPILMLTSVGNVTGLTFDKDEEMVPVDEFQEKPVLPSVLVDVVNRLLETKGGGDE